MKIRVGHLNYSIVPMPPEKAKKGLLGYWDSDKLEIQILSDYPAGEQIRTLFHELIHAMLHADNIKDKEFKEERVCEVLETPLTRLFQDNPKLHSVIQAAFKGKPIV
ncbi:MAG TPA: ImmA/IrrE family metallo-endopeptidase [Candidatus Angelobacter sp.]|nr:ImmA/IrrE family metallo-endopeptidase [Candidatus Angelobacter sp.]